MRKQTLLRALRGTVRSRVLQLFIEFRSQHNQPALGQDEIEAPFPRIRPKCQN